MCLCQRIAIRNKHASQANVLLEDLLLPTNGTREGVSLSGGQENRAISMHEHVRTTIQTDLSTDAALTQVGMADDTEVVLLGFESGSDGVGWTEAVVERVEFEVTLLAVECAFVVESAYAEMALDGR